MRCLFTRFLVLFIHKLCLLGAITLASATFAETTAEDEIRLAVFTEAISNGDLQTVHAIGALVIQSFPEDSIIRFQYAFSCYSLGFFDEIIQLTEGVPDLALLCHFCPTVDDLGFYYADWALWRYKVFSYCAKKQFEEALRCINLLKQYDDPSLVFVEYLIHRFQNNTRAAESIRNQHFAVPYEGNASGEIFAIRLLPLMDRPDQLKTYKAGALSHRESTLSDALAGFSMFLNADQVKGQQLIRKAATNINPNNCELTPILLGMAGVESNQIKTDLRKAHRSKWRKFGRLVDRYFEEIYANSDLEAGLKVIDETIQLVPADKDFMSAKFMVLFALNRWEEGAETIEDLLSGNPWASENVTCARLYRLLLAKRDNDEIQYRSVRNEFLENNPTDLYIRISQVIENPEQFEPLKQAFESSNKHNYLDILHFVDAMASEIRGDYTRAEQHYLELITNPNYADFLEPLVASRRIAEISPLAALQQKVEMSFNE